MIVLRHGQSLFNVHFSAHRRDPGIPDPVLTAEGERQADRAATALARAGIARIVCSPYTRALQTAQPIAARLSVPIAIEPLVRERYHFVCDIGSSAATLAAAWPACDFSQLPETWWPTETEPVASVEDRARRFRAALLATDAPDRTLLVSHWAFLLTLTGESLENGTWRRHDPSRPVAGWPDP